MKEFINSRTGERVMVEKSLKKERPELFNRVEIIGCGNTYDSYYARITPYQYKKDSPDFTEEEKDFFLKNKATAIYKGGTVDSRFFKCGIYKYREFEVAVKQTKSVEPIFETNF